MFYRLSTCINGLNICIYSGLYPCIPTALHIYIYIYIYMQHKTPNHQLQAIGATGSYNHHGTTIQQSPPESTIGFYQETS